MMTDSYAMRGASRNGRLIELVRFILAELDVLQ